MPYLVPSYKERISRISSIDDIDLELKRSKSYVMRLRKAEKNASLMSDKIILKEALSTAEIVLRRIRQTRFDIEEQINSGKWRSGDVS